MSGNFSINRPSVLKDVPSPVQVAPVSRATVQSPAQVAPPSQSSREMSPAPSSGSIQAPPSSSVISGSRPNLERSSAVSAISTGVSSPNVSASANLQQGAQAQAQVAGAHASTSSHGVTAQTQANALRGHAEANSNGVQANVGVIESSSSVGTSIAGHNVALVANGSALTAGIQANTDGIGAEASLVKISTGIKTSQGDLSIGTGIGVGFSATPETLSVDLGIVNASIPIKPVVTAAKAIADVSETVASEVADVTVKAAHEVAEVASKVADEVSGFFKKLF